MYYNTKEECFEAFKNEILRPYNIGSLYFDWIGDKGFYVKDDIVAVVSFDVNFIYNNVSKTKIPVVIYNKNFGKITTSYINLYDLGFKSLAFYKNPEIQGIDSSNKYSYEIIPLDKNTDSSYFSVKFTKSIERFMKIWQK